MPAIVVYQGVFEVGCFIVGWSAAMLTGLMFMRAR